MDNWWAATSCGSRDPSAVHRRSEIPTAGLWSLLLQRGMPSTYVWRDRGYAAALSVLVRILAAATGRENPGHVYDRFMTWLTSLPTAVLIIGGLAATLLLAAGARLAVRAVIPATQQDNANTIAAPLMTALGGLFALTMALTLAGYEQVCNIEEIITP